MKVSGAELNETLTREWRLSRGRKNHDEIQIDEGSEARMDYETTKECA